MQSVHAVTISPITMATLLYGEICVNVQSLLRICLSMVHYASVYLHIRIFCNSDQYLETSLMISVNLINGDKLDDGGGGGGGGGGIKVRKHA
jgi:hypothetical protein